MTPDEFKESVLDLNENLLNRFNEIRITELKRAEALMKRRIFVNGLASDLTPIGKYSVKPIYLNPDDVKSRFGGLLPKIKSPLRKLKNGQTRKTVFFDKGYSEFRKNVNRQNAYVDLELTGSLRDSIQVAKSNGVEVLGILSEEEVLKSEGNEERFGKDIFTLSDETIKEISDSIEEELADLLTSLF